MCFRSRVAYARVKRDFSSRRAVCIHQNSRTLRKSGCRMDWSDYLRDEAAKYRQLAEKAEDLSIKQDLLDLAVVCEDVANDIEDRIPGG